MYVQRCNQDTTQNLYCLRSETESFGKRNNLLAKTTEEGKRNGGRCREGVKRKTKPE